MKLYWGFLIETPCIIERFTNKFPLTMLCELIFSVEALFLWISVSFSHTRIRAPLPEKSKSHSPRVELVESVCNSVDTLGMDLVSSKKYTNFVITQDNYNNTIKISILIRRIKRLKK